MKSEATQAEIDEFKSYSEVADLENFLQAKFPTMTFDLQVIRIVHHYRYVGLRDKRFGAALVLRLHVENVVDLEFLEVRSYIRSLGIIVSDGVLSRSSALFRFVLFVEDFPNCTIVWMLNAESDDINNGT